MVHIDIEQELYDRIKKFVALNNLEYPSFRNFTNKVLKEKLDAMDKNG